jgi:hypothetical protein
VNESVVKRTVKAPAIKQFNRLEDRWTRWTTIVDNNVDYGRNGWEGSEAAGQSLIQVKTTSSDDDEQHKHDNDCILPDVYVNVGSSR